VTIERVFEKLDDIASKQADMNAILASQAVELKDHIRRTALLEEAVEVIRADVKPIEQHVAKVGLAAKIAAAIGAAAIGAIFKSYF